MATIVSFSVLDLERWAAYQHVRQLIELAEERHQPPIQELAPYVAKYQEAEVLRRRWEEQCYAASMEGDFLPDFPDVDQLTSLECGIVGFIYRRQLH
jgi:hypothetical protein